MTTKLTTITVMNQRLRVEYAGFGDSLLIIGVQGIEDIESFFNAETIFSIYEQTHRESLSEKLDEAYFAAEAMGDEISRGN